MTDSPDQLVRDLVDWVARKPRTYEEVMDAWRTSCPRLTVWEDAIDRGLIERLSSPGTAPQVIATKAGLAFLERTALPAMSE